MKRGLEERIGKSKEVTAKRLYSGNAGKKNKKASSNGGMVMERMEGLETEKK